MLTEQEARVFRDAANLATIRHCHFEAAAIWNMIDRLGGKHALTTDDHVRVYNEEQAAINAACTRRPA